MSEAHTNASGQGRPCGARTRRCTCTHHRRVHLEGSGGCETPDCVCSTFAPQSCRQTRVGRNGRCRMHGGTAAVGTAAGAYKHGGYSKFLPARLVEQYLEHLSDPELAGLRNEVALATTRVGELLARLEGSDQGTPDWQVASETYEQLMSANAAQDKPGVARLAATLGEVLQRGKDRATIEREVWEELRPILTILRRLKQAETQRLVDTSQMVYTDRVGLLIDALAEAVNRHVVDTDARRLIAGDFLRITEGAGRSAFNRGPRAIRA